jgi:arylsulfatase A-like enzyme
MLLWLLACQGGGGDSDDQNNPGDGPPDEVDTDTDTGTDTDEPPVGAESALQFDGEPPTNLIVISLDTTRRDYIGRFAGNDNTPNLDRVLAEGVSLDEHRSCSDWTAPSMTCVLTGLSPFDLGWWPWQEDEAVPSTYDELPTLAGQLYFQKGYHTTLVTSSPIFGAEFDFTRGFEFVYEPLWEPALNVTDDGLAAAQELLGLGGPFYLHVHYIDPHADYCAPGEYLDHDDYIDIGVDLCYDMYYVEPDPSWDPAEWQEALHTNLTELYDAEIEYWDAQFGRLWDELDAMGALDDTLVMFVTDHGEQIFERGDLGHRMAMGAEENRAVAGFWAKNIVPQAWPGNTVHQDLAASLQALYGIEPPTPPTGIPVGLAPEDRFVRGMNYWDPGTMRLSVVRGQTQLLYDWWGETHFYDHSLDPAGLVDYYDESDPDVQALWVDMQAFIDEIHAQWPSVGEPTEPW